MVTLYYTVGSETLSHILEHEGREFPPLPHFQTTFQPFIHQHPADQISVLWSSKNDKTEYVGFVIKFCVDADFLKTYEMPSANRENSHVYWIPTEDMELFNTHLIGPITVIDAHYGPKYQGESLIPTNLYHLNYYDQFVMLHKLHLSNGMDLYCEIAANWIVVLKNYLLWKKTDFSKDNLSDMQVQQLLEFIKDMLIKQDRWFLKSDL